MFLGIPREVWTKHRIRIRSGHIYDILDELDIAESALTQALAFATHTRRGKSLLANDDNIALIELINQVRNCKEHIEGYI